MSDEKNHPKNEEKTQQPPKKKEDDLHRPEDTLGEGPAGSPNAQKRSRLAD